MSFNGEMGKEFGDLAFAHVVRMAFAMKEDIPPDPVDIRLLGPD